MKINRDADLDVAKGLLISLLVLHHIVDIGMRVYGIDNVVLSTMFAFQRPMAVCFFMQAFFLITGVCSSFDQKFVPFLVKQVRTLIVPAFFFDLIIYIFKFGANGFPLLLKQWIFCGGAWFIVALVSSKLLMFVLKRVVRNRFLLLSLSAFLCFLGTILNEINVFPNLYWHRQTLDLLFFLVVGNLFKDQIVSWSKRIWPIYSYLLLCGAVFLILGNDFPYVTAGFGTKLYVWPIHIGLSFLGSIAIIRIARLLRRNSILEIFGKNSLIIYLVQGEALLLMVGMFSEYLVAASIRQSVFAVFIIVVTIMSLSMVAAYVLNSTRLRVVLGKNLKTNG